MQGFFEEQEARGVGDGEIVEHEEDGASAALGAEPIEERAADVIAHEARVLTSGAQGHARVIGERRVDELAEKLDDAKVVEWLIK